MKVNTSPGKNRPANGPYPMFGRKLNPGIHPGEIIDVKEDEVEFDNEGTKEKRGRVTLIFAVYAKPEDAPEGPVKIEHRVVAGTWQMDNLVETLFPDQVGKEFDLPTHSLKGVKCNVTTTTKPKTTGEGVWVNLRRITGPVTFAGQAPPADDGF